MPEPTLKVAKVAPVGVAEPEDSKDASDPKRYALPVAVANGGNHNKAAPGTAAHASLQCH